MATVTPFTLEKWACIFGLNLVRPLVATASTSAITMHTGMTETTSDDWTIDGQISYAMHEDENTITIDGRIFHTMSKDERMIDGRISNKMNEDESMAISMAKPPTR